MMAFIQLALISIYMCVLLIKSCDMTLLTATYRDANEIGKAVCTSYGFGETAQGAPSGIDSFG